MQAPFLRLMRLDKPVGTWLLLLPALWAITLTGDLSQPHTWKIIGLFILGAFVMRGAGCVINDIWDRDLDKHVARTTDRPLASGAISLPQAILFALSLTGVGTMILFQMNKLTVVLGIATIPLIALYPLMKRIIGWPQAFLGITFNVGALMGASAVTGTIPWSACLLYLGGIAWTLGYDTIYAHQDKTDDVRIGIKSTALAWGRYSKTSVAGFYGLALALWGTAVWIQGYAPWGLVVAAISMGWSVGRWNPENASACAKAFATAPLSGLLVLMAILTTRFLIPT